jgi:uncharacterized protein
MKASEGKLGRVFIIRLDDGDIIPDCIEKFAAEKQVSAGYAVMVGDIRNGQVMVGPRTDGLVKPEPMLLPIDGAHEVVAAGILAPDSVGKPVLHIHGALGRSGSTMTGCLRYGVSTWLVAELVLFEIIGADVVRLKDEISGFNLLNIVK